MKKHEILNYSFYHLVLIMDYCALISHFVFCLDFLVQYCTGFALSGLQLGLSPNVSVEEIKI